MTSGARHSTRGREQRDAHRRLQKRAAIVSRLVLYNENTNQDVWTRSCGDRAISRSAPMTVVPAQAGTYDHRSEIMGPRLRGDDGNKRRRSITPSAPRADPGFA